MILVSKLKKAELKRLDYKWVIVAISFLMVFVTLGFCSSSRSIYTFAITETLKLPRGAFSLNETFRYAATAVVNVFFGMLIAKFGAKKLICTGFVSLVISSLIYSVATTLAVFYIAGVFLGIGLSFTTTTMVGSVINKWCKKNKGTIMGAVLAANGIGAALATQVVTPIIYDESTPYGYKNAYRLVALILLIVGTIVFIFFKDEPKIKEQEEASAIKKKEGEWDGIKFSDAVRMPYFYMICVSVFFAGFILQGISGVAALHMQDIGLSHSFVATVLSIQSVALTVAKFLTGVIYDRSNLRVTTLVASVSAIIALVSLLLIQNNAAGYLLAVLYGVFAAFALPLETIMLPIYAGDLFGQRSYDKMLGIFVSVNMVGYAFGSPTINFVYDITGNYMSALAVCLFVMAAVIVLMQLSITASNRQKAKMGE